MFKFWSPRGAFLAFTFALIASPAIAENPTSQFDALKCDEVKIQHLCSTESHSLRGYSPRQYNNVSHKHYFLIECKDPCGTNLEIEADYYIYSSRKNGEVRLDDLQMALNDLQLPKESMPVLRPADTTVFLGSDIKKPTSWDNSRLDDETESQFLDLKFEKDTLVTAFLASASQESLFSLKDILGLVPKDEYKDLLLFVPSLYSKISLLSEIYNRTDEVLFQISQDPLFMTSLRSEIARIGALKTVLPIQVDSRSITLNQNQWQQDVVNYSNLEKSLEILSKVLQVQIKQRSIEDNFRQKINFTGLDGCWNPAASGQFRSDGAKFHAKFHYEYLNELESIFKSRRSRLFDLPMNTEYSFDLSSELKNTPTYQRGKRDPRLVALSSEGRKYRQI